MGPALSRRSFLFDEERANIAGNLMPRRDPLDSHWVTSRALPSPWRPRRQFYTADRSWKNLKLKVRVHMSR